MDADPFKKLGAERAYLFRHVLLRDAAYQLQPPADRGELHALALALLEAVTGGRPEPSELEPGNDAPVPRIACDPVSHELAQHARLARGWLPDAQAAEAAHLYRAASHAARTYQYGAAALLWKELAGLVEGANRAEALRRAAMAAYAAGRSDSVDLMAMALNTVESRQNPVVVGTLCNSFASVLRDSNRLEEAEPHYARAISIARETGDRKREAAALGNRALLYKMKGQLEESEQGFKAALEIGRELRDSRIELICLLNLSNLYRQLTRVDDAGAALDLAAALPQPDRAIEGRALGFRALLHWQVGRRDLAEELTRQSLRIAREVGDRRREGECVGHLAGLYSETNRVPESLGLFEQALEILREMGASRQEGYQLCDYAAALLRVGRVPDAKAAWREGAAILRGLNDERELEHKTQVMHLNCAKAGVPPLDA